MQGFRVAEEEVLQFEKELQCSLCKGILDDPRATNCHHLFCRNCVQQSIDGNNKCPICKMPVYRNELQKVQVLSNIVDLYKKLMFYSEPKKLSVGLPGGFSNTRMKVVQSPEAVGRPPDPSHQSAMRASTTKDWEEEEDLFQPPVPKKAKRVTFKEDGEAKFGPSSNFRSPPPLYPSTKAQLAGCGHHGGSSDLETLEVELRLLQRILQKFDPQHLKDSYGYEPIEELDSVDAPANEEEAIIKVQEIDIVAVPACTTNQPQSLDPVVQQQVLEPHTADKSLDADDSTVPRLVAPDIVVAGETLKRRRSTPLEEEDNPHVTPAKKTRPPMTRTPTSEGASSTTPGSEVSSMHSISPARWGPTVPEARQLFHSWTRSTKARRGLRPSSPTAARRGSPKAPKASQQRRSSEDISALAVRTRSSEFVLYCWGLADEDKATVQECCKRLGGRTVPFFQPSITHLVVGGDQQDGSVSNALATAANALLVRVAWMRDSLQHGQWLPQGQYEVHPGQAQKEKVSRAKQGNPRPLDKCNVLLYGHFAGKDLPCLADLEHLIRACGGQVLSDDKFCNLMAAKRNDKKAAVTIIVPQAAEVRHARDLGVGRVITVAQLLEAIRRWEAPRMERHA
eukprot:GGOE01062152.1.p1 GENE.GGOE01062152.1~~GGOE01062152.1.p1  ORF type:complete len:623 (-),score=104.93 GGOE01062152.1:269-2137(-)